MTPGQWVAERAMEWAEWVEKIREGGSGGNTTSSYFEYSGRSEISNQTIDYAVFDHMRCAEFDAAVGSLPPHLGVVFKMHWLGSESLTVDSSPSIKAGHCGLSRTGYYRRLDEANELLYRELH